MAMLNVHDEDDVDNELLRHAEEVVDDLYCGWSNLYDLERNWSDFLDNLESYACVTFGSLEQDSPAIRKIKDHVRIYLEDVTK